MAATDFAMATLADHFKSETDHDMGSMDAFFDFNNSAEALPSPKQNSYIERQPPIARSPSTATNFTDDNQTFSAPSHDYERYQQQFGLPTGSVANLAMMEQAASRSSFGGDDSFSYDNDFFATQDIDEDGAGVGADMLKQSSPAIAQQHSIGHPAIDDDFDYSEEPMPAPQRLYPGIHQQQASMPRVKQQRMAASVARPPPNTQFQQQSAMLMQRQSAMAPQEQLHHGNGFMSQPVMPSTRLGVPHHPGQVNGMNMMGPQAIPAKISTPTPHVSGPQPTMPQQPRPQQVLDTANRSGSVAAPSDEAFRNGVIREHLRRIRNDSVAQAQMEVANGTADSALPQLERQKKEEEEMDEDEKLLNSAEGKKLSSKERRQLRNKVSARAFRSRRKDYIHSLEDMLRQKEQAVSQVKIHNLAVEKENRQLHELIANLLRGDQFKAHVEELSRNLSPEQIQSIRQGGPSALATPTINHIDHGNGGLTPTAPQPAPVDTSNQQSQTFDFARLNLNNNVPEGESWESSGMGFEDLQPDTYAVFSVPEGPSLEQLSVESLSGKNSSSELNLFGKPLVEAKSDAPRIERMPMPEPKLLEPTVSRQSQPDEVDNLDDEFSLFSSSPATAKPSPSTHFPVTCDEKPSSFHLLNVSRISAQPAACLEDLCEAMDSAIERFSNLFG